MFIFAALRIATRALRRNLLRTLLTMLGIIIGVGAVIAMIGIGNGAKAQVEAQIASLGQNVIIIWSGSFTRGGIHHGWGSAGTLSIGDADAIRREIPGVTLVCDEVWSSAQVAVGNQNWFTQIRGESPDYFQIREWPMAEGVAFNDQEVRAVSKVAVIGKTVAKQLFPNTDPLGKIIRIKDVPFTVIGVLSARGLSLMGSDQDDVIIVPYTSAMKRLVGTTMLRAINVQTASAALMAPVQKQIAALLRLRHHIHRGNDDDFTVRTQQEITEMATAQSKTMTVLLAAIAFVSLIVGGIGIMNIMLVSVTERTREIGVRLAVGARGRDILLQFLIEAVTLGLVGGLLGIALGVGSAWLLSVKMGWATLISPESVVLAFGFSAAIGIFFGFYPARKAAQLDPIDALRYE